MSKLSYRFCKPAQLSEQELKRLYSLMEQAYEEISFERFLEDLLKKQLVLLLMDSESQVQGFTTFAVNPGQTGTAEYAILFSGDTIIHPNYWGSLALLKGWCAAVAQLMRAYPHKVWYWFLLSKGHRTYLFLPLFFKTYIPCLNAAEVPSHWYAIQERTAALLYPEYYRPGDKVLHFKQSLGQLIPELAKSSFDKQYNPHVELFLQLNPGFEKGDELLCFTQIHPDNMKGYPANYLRDALNLKQ